MMLEVAQIKKQYGHHRAIDDVGFRLEQGKVLAVIGPNGAGKTTLIKCLLGIVKFEGKVTVDDVDVARFGQTARKKIGYLPQNPSFYPDMTVAETILFFAELKSAASEQARKGIIAVGLENHSSKKVGELSGGMRQRLALAVAMLSNPSLLVLDEPATSLDMSARLELRRLITEQRSLGNAVLLSTHWLEDVPYIADQVLVLDRGRCTFFGDTRDAVSVSSSTSQVYLRIDAEPNVGIAVVKRLVFDVEVTSKNDWIIISCRSFQKATILKKLVASEMNILDIRIEEAVNRDSTFELPAQGLINQ